MIIFEGLRTNEARASEREGGAPHNACRLPPPELRARKKVEEEKSLA